MVSSIATYCFCTQFNSFKYCYLTRIYRLKWFQYCYLNLILSIKNNESEILNRSIWPTDGSILIEDLSCAGILGDENCTLACILDEKKWIPEHMLNFWRTVLLGLVLKQIYVSNLSSRETTPFLSAHIQPSTIISFGNGTLIDWLSFSQDLNPHENIWHIL